MNQPLIYRPGDRHSFGIKRVLVNGRAVEGVVMADPHRGIVDATRYPMRLDKSGKRVVTDRHRGTVELIFSDQQREEEQ